VHTFGIAVVFILRPFINVGVLTPTLMNGLNVNTIEIPNVCTAL